MLVLFSIGVVWLLLPTWGWFGFVFCFMGCGLGGCESLDLTPRNEDVAQLAVYSDIATLDGAADALSRHTKHGGRFVDLDG